VAISRSDLFCLDTHFIYIIPFQPHSSNPTTRNFEPTIASNPTSTYVKRVLDCIEFFLIPRRLNFPFYSISYNGNNPIFVTQYKTAIREESVSVLDRSTDVDFIYRDSECQQCIYQQSDTRSDRSRCTSKAPQPKARRLKAHVSKKSTATQRARHEAMAARSLKKKWELQTVSHFYDGEALRLMEGLLLDETEGCLDGLVDGDLDGGLLG
jgi:hypothetical protein